MPAYVPITPPLLDLQSTRVGRPVSHRHGRAWQDGLHFLLGHCTQRVISCNPINAVSAASSANYRFAYKRSPGALGLLVAVELFGGSADGRTSTVVLTRVTGATAYLPATGGGLLRSGSPSLSQRSGYWADRVQFADVLGVSGYTAGALEWINLAWTSGAGTGDGSIRAIHAIEVPRRTIAVASYDAGVDGAWPFTGNDLYDGTTSTGDGFVRLAYELERCRKRYWHAQVNRPETYADSWALGASVGVFAAVSLAFGATQSTLDLRVRRLYTSATSNAVGFVCRYSTNHATAGAQLKVTATSRTTGTTSTSTFTLPASGVATWVALAEQAFTLPTDGDDQEVAVTFEFKTDAGASLYLAQLGFVEAET